jgi:hypothetical protein
MINSYSVCLENLVMCIVYRECRKTYILLIGTKNCIKKLKKMTQSAILLTIVNLTCTGIFWLINMALILTKSKYSERNHPEEYEDDPWHLREVLSYAFGWILWGRHVALGSVQYPHSTFTKNRRRRWCGYMIMSVSLVFIRYFEFFRIFEELVVFVIDSSVYSPLWSHDSQCIHHRGVKTPRWCIHQGVNL